MNTDMKNVTPEGRPEFKVKVVFCVCVFCVCFLCVCFCVCFLCVCVFCVCVLGGFLVCFVFLGMRSFFLLRFMFCF